MDAHLKLKATVSVIGSTSDFTYKWAINAGLPEEDAARLTLSVTELVTNIVQYAYPNEVGEFEITFHHDLTQVEVVIYESGEPFDPDRHQYDRRRALEDGDFDGAGLALTAHMVDNFMFLHTGKSNKEFRLVKNVPAQHIADMITNEEKPKVVREADVTETYRLSIATPEDAEDIAKLMYRTYGYTYAKDDIYFPKKNEVALASGEKFAVMVRTSSGEAAGHFAVLRPTDSNIGEVAEVVVATPHRRRGLMTRMLNALVGLAKKHKMAALFGEAVTVHPISQIVNHKLGFHSSAIILGNMPLTKYRDLADSYPQDVTVVLDFLLLDQIESRVAFLPPKYRQVLSKIYGRQGIKLEAPHPVDLPLRDKTEFDLTILYDNKTAVVVIQDYGNDLPEMVDELSESLGGEGLNTILFDLPLDNPYTAAVVGTFEKRGYVFSGLMFLFHGERDYLRMQHTIVDLDMELVHVYSDMAKEIKQVIEKERQWIMKSRGAGSASG